MNIWRKFSRGALALCGLLALFTPKLAHAGFGSALVSGSGSYVTAPPINLSASNTITMEAWITPTFSYQYQDIIRQQVSGAWPDWLLSIQNYGSNLAFGLTANGVYQELHVPTNPNLFFDGKWHHFAATYDGTTKILYQDGVQIGSASQSGNLSFTASSNCIGAALTQPSPSEFFYGAIDEVRIWGVARGVTAINASMFTPLTGTEPGLAAYYKFDEGTGTVAADSSNHGLTGTLAGSAWTPSSVPPAFGPSAFTGTATNLTTNSATLNGTAYPRGAASMAYFDYGTTTNYDSHTPLQDISSNSVLVAVSAPISSLSFQTAYHFRLATVGNGTTNFGADRVFFTIGNVGSTALSFNGAAGAVILPAIRPAPTNGFSLEAWIKPANLATFSSGISLQQSLPYDPDWLLNFRSNGTVLAFGLTASGYGYQELQIPINPSDLTDGYWHHVAATYDNTNSRLYIDGVLKGRGGPSGPLVFNGTSANIGGYFNGQIDEVSIWSVARSVTDINNDIFAIQNTSQPGLLAYYRFNDGTSAFATDSSPNGRTGTLVNGGPVWVNSTGPGTAAPLASTGFPSNVTSNSATLNGTANPAGIATTVHFDFGSTTNYSSQTPGQNIGSAPGAISVSAPISGLSASTACHYRLAAVGGGTTNYGADHLFYTIGPIGGTALSFNGTNSFATIPLVNPGFIKTFSLEAWVKPVNFPPAGFSAVIDLESYNYDYPDLRLSFQKGGTILAFGITTQTGYTEAHAPINPLSLTDGLWHHLAATYDGTNQQLYVDGILIGSLAQSEYLTLSGTTVSLGAAPGSYGGPGFFNGQIDEVRIWSVARSAADITNNAFTTLSTAEPGLLGYYRFDEGSGASAMDSSPNGRTGTLLNNPLWVPSTVPSLWGPVLLSGPPSSITSNSAILNGTVNPRGNATTLYFDFGTTTNYGLQTPLQNVGNGYAQLPVFAPVSGLSLGTIYHFRPVAIGGGTTNFGFDGAFSAIGAVGGTALSFNGTNSYLSIPPIISLPPALTLEAWVKPLNLTNTAASDILRQQPAIDNADWLLAFQSNGKVLAFAVNAGTYHYSELHVPINPSDYTDGNWHHIAGTYDGTGMLLYVDGMLVGGQYNPGALVDAGGYASIGAALLPNGSSEFFSGQIEEVRIWSVARSAADIVNNMLTTLSGDEPGLLGYYRLNDGSGTSAVDSSQNGSTGTLINNPVWVPSVLPAALPSLVFTGLPSNPTANSATLNGTAYARGAETTVHFDYGITTNYGAQTPEQDIGKLAVGIAISAPLSGLAPVTGYHFRLVAIGGGPTNFGVDQFFYTFYTIGPVGGTALAFNGSNSYVSVPTFAPTTSNLTAEAWVNAADLNTTSNSIILCQQASNSFPDCLLAFENNGNVLSFGLRTSFGYHELRLSINPFEFTGSWHHLAATYDGATKRLYVDGVLMGSATESGYLYFLGSPPGAIGASPLSGGSGFFNGQIDEVRIWGVARSGTQLSNNLFTAFSGAETGLFAYYRFDDATGLTAFDASPYARTGTLVNGPLWIASSVPATVIPFADTGFPSNVATSSAILNGMANPAGIATTVYFDYGITTNYGTQTPVQDIGSASGGVSVSAPVFGLSPGSACHYHLVAIGGGITNFGGDQLFYTIGPVGGSALSFNGSNSAVSIPGFNPGATNTMSLEAWIKPSKLTNSFVSMTSAILSQEYFYLSPADYNLTFTNNGSVLLFGHSTGTGGYKALQVPVNPSDFTDGNWHHIAATYDGTSNRLYVDGLLLGSAPASGSLFLNPGQSSIGAALSRYGINSAFFNGLIDEVRIWSVARSAADINNFRFSTLSGTEPGLVAYYRFDDGAGPIAADSSPNLFWGSLTNNAVWVPSTVPTNLGPVALTGSASPPLTNSAIVNGNAYPRGIATMVYFDYGLSTNYGAQTPLQDVGGGMSEVSTPTLISNLIAASTYHYRIAAIGGGVTNVGKDHTFTTSGPIGGTALSFNGTNASVSIPVLSPGTTNAFSFEAWVKPAKPVNTTNTIFTVFAQIGSGYDIRLDFEDRGFGPLILFGLKTTGGYQEMSVFTPSNYTDGNWHHLAATYDGTTQRLYMDGILLGSQPQSGNLAFTGTACAIGGTPTFGATRLFCGQIDEVRIWNSARSTTDIVNNLFTTMGTPPPASLLDYYRFDGGAGNSAVDSSGFGHTGTLVNGAAWTVSTVPSFLPLVPTVSRASSQNTNSAGMSGTVLLRDYPGTVWFNYGIDTNHGFQTAPQNFAAAPAPVSVSAAVAGLLPAQEYHCQLVASNVTGTYYSPDRVFFTYGIGGGGTALGFNGTNNYVTMNPLNFSAGSNLTLEAWIKPSSFTSNAVSDILRQQSPGRNPDWLLAFYNNGNGLKFGLSTATRSYFQVSAAINPSDFSNGSWHHVAGTYDGLALQLYVDGILIGSAAQSGKIVFTAAASGGIAASSTIPPADYFNGQIDDVRIWNVAKSPAQINQLMTSELTGAEPGLVTYYRFNEGSGTNATDLTGNGHNGMLMNSPAWVASTAPITPFPPGLTGFSPAFGKQGTTVTLSGTNLLAITGVLFNGISASFTTNSNFSITAIVPAGVTTGPITITNTANTFTTLTNFMVDTTAPSVSITSPTNATFVTSLAGVKAVASDDIGGSGINTVTFSLQRQSDLGFWSGSAWGVSNALPAVLTNGQWSATSVMPSGTNLNNGAYTLYATAFDQVGNSASTQIGVTVDNSGSSPINSLANGNIQIHFAGIPGKTYRIQSSTDLSTWVDIGSVLVDSSGVLQFEDPTTASHSTRFYRTVIP